MADVVPVICQANEGEAFWVLGGLAEVKIPWYETNGEWSVVQFTYPDGRGPAPHTHPADETIYLAEGRLRIHLGRTTTEVGPGSVIFLPRGTLEWWEPIGGPATFLIMWTPGGMDRFFSEVGEPAPRREMPLDSEPLTQEGFERMVTVGPLYGMEFDLERPPVKKTPNKMKSFLSSLKRKSSAKKNPDSSE